MMKNEWAICNIQEQTKLIMACNKGLKSHFSKGNFVDDYRLYKDIVIGGRLGCLLCAGAAPRVYSTRSVSFIGARVIVVLTSKNTSALAKAIH
jgi:hypothetical protein